MNTLNDRLNNLGTYLKIKAFQWVLIRTGGFIGPERLFKKTEK